MPVEPQPSSDLRRRRRWCALAIGYWLAMAAALHVPLPDEEHGGPKLPENTDKTAHYALYGLLSWVLCRTADEFASAPSRRTAVPYVYGPVFVACLAYGVVDELTQPWTGRRCELADWYADVGGTALGIVAAIAGRSLRRMRAAAHEGESSTPPATGAV